MKCKEVDFGDETVEVVYDDENDLVYKRKTDSELADAIGGDPDEDFTYTDETNVWGVTQADSVDAMKQLAGRYDKPVGEAWVTAEYLRDMADRLDSDVGSTACRMYVSEDLPVVITPKDRPDNYVLAPRIGVEDGRTAPYYNK